MGQRPLKALCKSWNGGSKGAMFLWIWLYKLYTKCTNKTGFPAHISFSWIKSFEKRSHNIFNWVKSKLLVDPPLVTSDLVGLLLMLLWAPAPAPLKVSTELTRLYTGIYSALLDLTELNLSFSVFWVNSTLGTSVIMIGYIVLILP